MNERINPLAPLLTPVEVNQFNVVVFRKVRQILDTIKQHPLDFPHPEWNLGCLQDSEVQQVEDELILDAFVEGFQRLASPYVRTSTTDEQELGKKELRYQKMTRRWEEFISTATRAINLNCSLVPDRDYRYNELPVRTTATIPFVDAGVIIIRPAVGFFGVNLRFKGKRDYKRHIPYLKNLASIPGVRAFGHCDQKTGYESIGNEQLPWFAPPQEAMQRGRQHFDIDTNEALYAFLLTAKDLQAARN